MAIEIEKSFSVDAGAEEVWAFLVDPHRVAGALPGASITEQVDERTYKGQMMVKVGPVASNYKGTITFERLDPETRTAEVSGRGQDVRGKGGADMKMTSTVAARGDGGTDVQVTSVVNVTGMLAQFGRGMIQDVSDELFQVFTDRLRAELTSTSEGSAVSQTPTADSASDEALDVLSLGAAAGRKAFLRLLTRPGFWIGVGVVAVIVYWIFVR